MLIMTFLLPGSSGEPILLPNKNRALWDRLLVRRGLAALNHAESPGGSRGPHALQAARNARSISSRGTRYSTIAGRAMRPASASRA